ncbi:MAG: hypothetical protein FWD61_00785 [Phycisphaerales bacterium]|nr:hypothetical protein [Phycisphaerales bacterium]
MFTITNTAIHHLRAASDRVIKTSWGVMGQRHAIFIGLRDDGDRWGWGESWINFPVWSPFERLAAFQQAYFPYLQGREVVEERGGVRQFMMQMFNAFVGPAIQANNVGSLIAELCAVELALWDLEAKTKNVPMNQLWFSPPANPAKEVEIYASGINSPLPMKEIDAMLERGVRIFKLKVGFGAEDLANIKTLEKHFGGDRGGGAQIAIDTNRHWTAAEAAEWLPILKDHNVRWLEEALRADEESHYPALQKGGWLRSVPLSAGENVWVNCGDPQTLAQLADFPVDILQPDITKNCPPIAAVDLIPLAKGRNKKVIPHYLGSALGQAASLHLASGCSAANAPPLCEWDINPNPLRTDIFDFQIKNGKLQIPTTPGLGWHVDPQRFNAYKH